MRILIVTHAPISPEFGVSQVAINLAEALRYNGHEVILWSPQPLPQNIKSWQIHHEMRKKLDAFIKIQAPFDIIDSPSTLITKKVAKSTLVICRNIQPDILYVLSTLNEPFIICSINSIFYIFYRYLYQIYILLLIFQGWRRAKHILCLGSLDLLWMRKWLFWWRYKLSFYVNALAPNDQIELTKIRQLRKNISIVKIRFLWIGRWVNHKGIDTLLKFITEWESSRPQDTFSIAGCGTNALKQIPINLIESGKVKILPSFTRNELYNLLDTHDIGLFTSKVEGWGLSINEMLESGMPVFATQAGGVIDLQTFNLNLLQQFPPTLKVISEISQSFDIPEEYYNEFSWNRIAEKYEKIAEICLAGNSLT